MKIQLILADFVALLEVVDEHIDRNFPGVDAPVSLRKLRAKLIHLTRMYPKPTARPSDRSSPGSEHLGRSRAQQRPKAGKAPRKRSL